MRKALLLLLLVSSVAWSQTAPSGYTTQYSIRRWAANANPSADSLNANWNGLDSAIAYLANKAATNASGLGWIGFIDSTAQTPAASIAATNITDPVTSATGLYRVSVYLEVNNAGSGGDSANVRLQWQGESSEAVTDSLGTPLALTASDAAHSLKSFTFYHYGGDTTSVKYSTYEFDNSGGGTFDFHISIERLK